MIERLSPPTSVGRFRLGLRRTGLVAIAVLMFSGCSNQVLKAAHSQEILKNDEFDNAIKVQNISNDPPAPIVIPSGTYVRLPGPKPDPSAWPKKKSRKELALERKRERYLARLKERREKAPSVAVAESAAPPVAEATPGPHEPDIEDADGFIGRRPIKDPFHVGEKVTLDVSYFGVSAGDVTIEVRPFVQVNGSKHYHFAGTAISTSVFAVFYAIDDMFETFVDYMTMLPSSYALHVKETKQLRETRAVFDEKKKLATWWDKKIDSDQKVEEKKKEWEIPSYSQNVFSVFFYLRTFQLDVGKKMSFRVAHENENLLVTAEVIRKEHITVPAGEFDTVVIKPKIELNGVFKPVGDIFLWLTDDDRKFFVRIESKIKIGTIVGVAKKVELGVP